MFLNDVRQLGRDTKKKIAHFFVCLSKPTGPDDLDESLATWFRLGEIADCAFVEVQLGTHGFKFFRRELFIHILLSKRIIDIAAMVNL